MAKKLDEILKNIEIYKSEKPQCRELLDMLGEVLILREEHRRRLTRDIFPVEGKLVKSKLSGGLPLIDFSSSEFNLAEPKEYFLALLKIAERFHPEETAIAMQEMEESSINYESLIQDMFSMPETVDAPADADEEPTTSEEDKNGFDLIGFFLEESLRPALEFVAESYAADIAASHWSEGYCPVCGKEPKIGALKDDEGRRFLFCNQCGIEWAFRRIKCPFCGNEEQKTLSYFTVDNDERYRVDVCDECKRYVKIVDIRSRQIRRPRYRGYCNALP